MEEKLYDGFTINELFDRMANKIPVVSKAEEKWRLDMEKENNKLNGGFNF